MVNILPKFAPNLALLLCKYPGVSSKPFYMEMSLFWELPYCKCEAIHRGDSIVWSFKRYPIKCINKVITWWNDTWGCSWGCEWSNGQIICYKHGELTSISCQRLHLNTMLSIWAISTAPSFFKSWDLTHRLSKSSVVSLVGSNDRGNQGDCSWCSWTISPTIGRNWTNWMNTLGDETHRSIFNKI